MKRLAALLLLFPAAALAQPAAASQPTSASDAPAPDDYVRALALMNQASVNRELQLQAQVARLTRELASARAQIAEAAKPASPAPTLGLRRASPPPTPDAPPPAQETRP